MVGKHRAFGLCLRHDLIPWASSEIEWLPAPWTVDALRKKPDTCSRNLQDNLPRQLDLDWRSGYIPLEHDALYKGSLAVVKMPWSQCHLKKSKYPILIRQPWKHGQVQQWGPVGGPYCVPGKESASLVLLGFLGQLLFSESQLLAVLEKVPLLSIPFECVTTGTGAQFLKKDPLKFFPCSTKKETYTFIRQTLFVEPEDRNVFDRLVSGDDSCGNIAGGFCE
ncbi:hypothetical protein TGPRC2_293520 [Toxoplasma gondii TgCatPRC2]|uniref:Uncharacterized protein n=9 Tax=Toxoplasma gondii TaxID=5811 RepID=A0A125YT73_TOXGV|nr:hypothetical protein TGME49_293520 [Toxoplasma gondii ME49]EPR57630.1 hypothetical protein TGGT1_293520 [Toxoplasma gondii GT1]ESS29249.1 hypothetical protein TGVEG_293520 [Toxoplasma gondii VEG]KAF4646096.1 hypothetical protein TGRH88_018830 [Toxoplasma gondii]KFG35725.1 hypothetical protein TGP89_293520 [Toxoplasma gondii p89]KYF38866.1 hypothetical protein TGARI_293520 [Toxoplasma gondii ARI]KYK65957.1 hypothetical protein TGPRC2_293520 [Toxoplasma gondii TgCatPRC2]PUA86910.1 hypotheti|eukprot:XP_018638619.1 hypothetical protein TGME49_293520 [Toxoplasma gondii ME49]